MAWAACASLLPTYLPTLGRRAPRSRRTYLPTFTGWRGSATQAGLNPTHFLSHHCMRFLEMNVGGLRGPLEAKKRASPA